MIEQGTIQPLKKIFISYSIKDKDLAEIVKRSLEQAGFLVFLAHETLRLSDEWIQRIFDEIKSCDFFVPIRTENFTTQVFPEQECGIALGHNKKIIPLIVGTDPRHYGFLHFRQGYFMEPDRLEESCKALSEKLKEL